MWLRLSRPFIQSVHTPSAVQFAPTRSKVTMDDMLFTLPAQRVSYRATITLSCRHHFIHWLKFSRSTAFVTRLHTATAATITRSPFFVQDSCFLNQPLSVRGYTLQLLLRSRCLLFFGGGLFFWVFLRDSNHFASDTRTHARTRARVRGRTRRSSKNSATGK